MSVTENGNMDAELLYDVTLDPIRQYAAVRVWNEYLKTREYCECDAASEKFVRWMGRLMAAFQSPIFQNRNQDLFDEDTRRARRFELSADRVCSCL